MLILPEKHTRQPQATSKVAKPSEFIAGDTYVLTGSVLGYDLASRYSATVTGVSRKLTQHGQTIYGISNAKIALPEVASNKAPYTIALLSRGLVVVRAKQIFTCGVKWISGFASHASMWDTSISSLRTVSTPVSGTGWVTTIITVSSAKEMSLYTNGQFITSVTFGGFASDAYSLLSAEMPDGSVAGEVPIVLKTDVCWTPQQAHSWHLNPWQIFQPDSVPFYFNAVSGGGVTLSGNNSSQSTQSSSGSVTQSHILSGDNSVQSSTSASAAIGQTHVLTGSNSSQATSSSSGAVSTDNAVILSGDNSAQSSTSASAAIGQTHVLTGSHSSQSTSSSVGQVLTGGEIVLTGDNSAQNSQSSTGSIIIAGELIRALPGFTAMASARKYSAFSQSRDYTVKS